MMSPSTPSEDKQNERQRIGMVQVSDGKSRPRPARLVLTLEAVTVQEEVPVQKTKRDLTVPHARERMVQITRQKVGGLGLSIKGGSEHKLPILISKIYKDQAADQTGQLFVGDAVIKVNGEYITACKHDDAVTILKNAGDIVVLTVKHYRAATPFLQKVEALSDTESNAGDDHPSLHNKVDANCNEKETEHTNGGWQSASEDGSRPGSALAPREPLAWRDVVTVPLMMAYVTRYVYGTDKLRPAAFEVRGARPDVTSGVVHVSEPAALSRWLKVISDNIVGLTSLQMKLLNRQLPQGERIEYMGWVQEGLVAAAWQRYSPRFLLLKGTDVMLFDVPPANASDLAKCPEVLKVYQTMFRTIKESETVDWRQHCFIIQSSSGATAASGEGPRYFSAETRQELLRLEAAWTANVLHSVIKLEKKTFTVVHCGRAASLTLDWAGGFSLREGPPAQPPLWAFRFSQLRGSSDDGKSKLKLHFQDTDTRVIETKELECQILQSLLFCMHAFLTAKVASVDPAFLASMQRANT